MSNNIKFKAKELHIDYLKTNRINGIVKYSYEDLLLEFVNNSVLPLKYNGKPFKKINDQSNGEPDICNGQISFDFKLLVDQDTMKSEEAHISKVSVPINGLYFKHPPERYDNYYSANLFIYLQGYNKLSDEEKYNQYYEEVIKVLKVDKNIIIFVPMIFTCEETTDIGHIASSFIKQFNEFFNNLIIFRKRFTNKYIYVTFILNSRLIFIEYNEGIPNFLDDVSVEKSSIYSYINSVREI